jgi:Arc/MetJ-type ribon-helix-helix transcriptional regulator
MSLFPCKPETVRRAVALLTVTAVSLGAMSDTARAAAPEKKSRKPRVLVLGDSVFSMLLVADEALAELNGIIPVIYRGQPCQKLLTRGCIPEVELSALQQFKNARGEFTDAVVVATGYNENRPDALRESLREFKAEAKRQRVKLIWATYRIAGNVKGKATQFNSELRRAQKRDVMVLRRQGASLARGNRQSRPPTRQVPETRTRTYNVDHSARVSAATASRYHPKCDSGRRAR